MTALLRKKHLPEMITAHHPVRGHFKNPSSGPPIPYDTVDSDMEPSREFFWGRIDPTGVYFISDSVPKKLVAPILQMEHYRHSQAISHRVAVAHAVELLPSAITRKSFLHTVLTFYAEEAASFEEPAGDQEDHDKDIIATKEYLASLFN